MLPTKCSLIRAFFAIDFNDADKQRIVQSLSPPTNHAAIRWLPSAGWHITLCFLGTIPYSLINDLSAQTHLLLASANSFVIELPVLAYFPSPVKPRFMTLIPYPQIELGKLAQLTQMAAHACGLHPKIQAYRPHISLAKLKARMTELPPLVQYKPISALTIDRFSLFQSLGHSQYNRLASFTLK